MTTRVVGNSLMLEMTFDIKPKTIVEEGNRLCPSSCDLSLDKTHGTVSSKLLTPNCRPECC